MKEDDDDTPKQEVQLMPRNALASRNIHIAISMRATTNTGRTMIKFAKLYRMKNSGPCCASDIRSAVFEFILCYLDENV